MPVSGYWKRRFPRGIQGSFPDLHEFDVVDLTQGIWGNRSASEIPLNAATYIENVRFEDTGIRPEFGVVQVGESLTDPTNDKILGMADHKYMDSDELFHRVIRVVSDAGYPRVDVWDGVTWAIGTPNTTYQINDRPVSIASTQGRLLFCDGDHLWIWDPQSATLQTYNVDWGPFYVPEDGATQSKYVANVAYDHSYRVRWYIKYTIETRYIKPSDKPHSVKFRVRLRRKSADGFYSDLWTKTYDTTNIMADTIDHDIYTIDEHFDETFVDDQLGGGWLYIVFDNYETTGAFYDIDIKIRGYNHLIDGDYFLNYQAYDDPAGDLYYITQHPEWDVNNQGGESPPAPSFIFPFGDRLIALQDKNILLATVGYPGVYPPQTVVRASEDGNVLAWTSNSNSSISVLLDSPNDPFDDVMAMGFVANNVAALIRKRTIMRVSETGNVTIPVAYNHWIEGIGTESPFSVAQARDGICFLGHNLMVYYFDGTGPPQPVGVPVHQYLIETVTSNLDRVHAAYDWIFEDYILGVPEGDSSEITRFWIFDVGAFLDEQKVRWRTRTASGVTCLSSVSTL